MTVYYLREVRNREPDSCVCSAVNLGGHVAQEAALVKVNPGCHIARPHGHLKSSSYLVFQQYFTFLMLPPSGNKLFPLTPQHNTLLVNLLPLWPSPLPTPPLLSSEPGSTFHFLFALCYSLRGSCPSPDFTHHLKSTQISP